MNKNNYLGNIIKDIRLSQSKTQKELCEDICSIKQLSRIESNTSSPSAIIFSQLSERLCFTLNDYLPYSDCKNGYLVKNEIEYLYSLYYELKYDELLAYLETSTVLSKTTSEYAFMEMEWLQMAVEYNTNNRNNIYDIEHIKKLLKIEHTLYFDRILSKIELKFVNSLVTCYSKSKCYDEGIQLASNAIENYETHNASYKDTTYIRLHINLAYMYRMQLKYKESIQICEKAINVCISNHSMAHLAELFLSSCISHCKLGRLKQGKELSIKYVTLRRIYGNESYVDYEDAFKRLTEDFGLDQID